MKRILGAAAILSTFSSLCFSQNVTTTQQAQVTQSSNAPAAVTASKVTQVEFVTQLRSIYASAGVDAEVIERLLLLDRQIYDAWIGGDMASVRRYRLDQRSILGPEGTTKVHTYLQSHPLPPSFPSFVVNTWAPDTSFNPDITVSNSGVLPNASSINIGGTGPTNLDAVTVPSASTIGTGTNAARSTTGAPAGTAASTVRMNGTAVLGGAPMPSSPAGGLSGNTQTNTRNPGGGTGTGTTNDSQAGTGTVNPSYTGAAGTVGASGTMGLSGSASAGATGNMAGSTTGAAGASGSAAATGQMGTGSTASGTGSHTGSASGGGTAGATR